MFSFRTLTASIVYHAHSKFHPKPHGENKSVAADGCSVCFLKLSRIKYSISLELLDQKAPNFDQQNKAVLFFQATGLTLHFNFFFFYFSRLKQNRSSPTSRFFFVLLFSVLMCYCLASLFLYNFPSIMPRLIQRTSATKRLFSPSVNSAVILAPYIGTLALVSAAQKPL